MSSDNFWLQLSTFCNHLSPVAGPLLEKVGHTAQAIDNAQREIASLDGDISYFRSISPAKD